MLGLETQEEEEEEDRRGILGYTGYKPMEYPSGNDRDPRVPIVGYSGWYPGKVSGHLGKVELHRGPISCPEDESGADIYKTDEGNDEDDSSPQSKAVRARKIRYREANTALKQRKVSVDGILDEICQKLEVIFPGLAEKRIRILKPFQVLDKARNGRVNTRDFEHCLLALNIVLPWAELVGIQGKFDPDSTGMIAYVDFVHQICPPLRHVN